MHSLLKPLPIRMLSLPPRELLTYIPQNCSTCHHFIIRFNNALARWKHSGSSFSCGKTKGAAKSSAIAVESLAIAPRSPAMIPDHDSKAPSAPPPSAHLALTIGMLEVGMVIRLGRSTSLSQGNPLSKCRYRGNINATLGHCYLPWA